MTNTGNNTATPGPEETFHTGNMAGGNAGTETGNNAHEPTKTKELPGLKYTREGRQPDTGGRNQGGAGHQQSGNQEEVKQTASK